MFVGSGCIAPLVVAAIVASSPAPRVAVLDAEVESAESETQVQEVTTAGFVRGLAATGIDAVGVQESCGEPACMKAIAGRAQASHVARSRVSATGTDYGFVLELVEVETGRVVQTLEGSCEICTYEEAADAVAEAARRFELEAAPTRVSLVVRSNPEGATVHIDGTAAGSTPFRGELESGEHEITLDKNGYESVGRRVRAETDPMEVQFDLFRSRYRPGPPGYAGWAVAAAGLATLVGGVVLIGINEREVKSNCSGQHVDTAGNCEFRYDTLAGGVTMTVLGAVGMGVGAGLVLWDRKRTGSNVTAGVGLDGLRLQGRF